VRVRGTRFLVMATPVAGQVSARWEAIHAAFKQAKGIPKDHLAGHRTERYTDPYFHPSDARLLVYTINPEDVALAASLILRAEYEALKTTAQMEAEGWFPTTAKADSEQRLAQSSPVIDWAVVAGATAAAGYYFLS
jgi:hypothetical protein